VGGAVVVRAVAALGDVADAGRGAADHRGALRIRGAVGGGPRAALGDVTDAGRRAADVGALPVVRAGRRRARAHLRDVAGADGGAALGRGGLEGVGGAVVAGDVADAGRRTADGGALLVVRAGGGRPGAHLGDVADAGGRAALGRGGLERIRRAVIAGAVATLGDVADAGRRTADGGALRVVRAGGGRPGAHLGDVADAGGCAALGRGGLERIRR